MTAREIRGKLQHRVFNNMPIRLINLTTPEMQLMERSAVLEYLTSEMNSVTEDDIQKEANHAGMSSASADKIRGRIVDRMVEEKTRFAILSHTWGKDEPSYKDLKKYRNLVGQGYEKLKKFCEVAYKEYGVEFAWADTVCIDKTSSAELDESIRSMFKWYESAYICIAYLAETTSLDDMPADRWFTRGWTLQELLAPRRMKFYAGDWAPLTSMPNEKGYDRLQPLEKADPACGSILNAVHQATTISMRQIHDFRPRVDKDIAMRMSWVAKRDTTRGEDTAYCMMGIFGVSISIAYGEGPQHAFFRLFKAILDISNDPDIFNWAGEPIRPDVHPSRMLPSSPECYLSHQRISHNNQREFEESVVEPPTLTSAGLRMRVVVVPVDLESLGPSSKDGSTLFPTLIAKFRCALTRKKIDASLLDPRDPDGRLDQSDRDGLIAQFALGIWNIDAGLAPIPPTCLATVLYKWRKLGWNPKWRRVGTAEVVSFESDKVFNQATLEELERKHKVRVGIETLYL